jgi:hypothetical protein
MKFAFLCQLLILGIVAVPFTSSAATVASHSDEAKIKIESEYLKIGDVLSQDSMAGIKASATQIIEVSQSMETDSEGSQIRKAATKLSQVSNLKQAREAFKALSKPVVGWVQSEKPADIEIMYCPMAGSKWIQRKGAKPGNPFYGKEMASCGEKAS